MKKYLKLSLYGFFIWLTPFALGMLLFPVISTESALFDTIMAVTLTIAATVFSFHYLKNTPFSRSWLTNPLLVGTYWLVIALILDTPFFILSDMTGMSAQEYFADIGLQYLMIPVITIGIGNALKNGTKEDATII